MPCPYKCSRLQLVIEFFKQGIKGQWVVSQAQGRKSR
jgi:hypothetical protein